MNDKWFNMFDPDNIIKKIAHQLGQSEGPPKPPKPCSLCETMTENPVPCSLRYNNKNYDNVVYCCDCRELMVSNNQKFFQMLKEKFQ